MKIIELQTMSRIPGIIICKHLKKIHPHVPSHYLLREGDPLLLPLHKAHL